MVVVIDCALLVLVNATPRPSARAVTPPPILLTSGATTSKPFQVMPSNVAPRA
jgi:hypothetical protein